MRFTAMFPALCFLVAPAVAWAGDAAIAEALFRDGRRAADAGDYALACPKFEESYRLDPAPGTLLNLADCEENQGHVTRAWLHFRQLHDQLPASDDRKPLAEARARAVERRLPKLRIVLASTAPASVKKDNLLLGRASLGTSLPVEPGRHVIVVTSPGRAERRYDVSVAIGEEKEVAVTSGEPLPPVQASAPPAARAHARPREPPPLPQKNVQRTAAFVVGGVGVATLVAGTVFGVAALANLASSNAACAGNVCSSQDAVSQFGRAQSFAVAADVSIGVGIVFVGTAILLALTSPHRSGTVGGSLPVWIGGRF